MAHIKSMCFSHVGRMEGCCCDKCGQYIQNIITVNYTDGLRLNYGTDCFNKLWHSGNLSDYGKKLMSKTLKSMQKHYEMLEAEKQLTEETDMQYQNTQEHFDWKPDDYWYGHPWEEWHQWRINVWWPKRFEEDQKAIDKFSKVNFKREA